MEMLGIEPRTSYMQSMRSTTELHPPLVACVYFHILGNKPIFSILWQGSFVRKSILLTWRLLQFLNQFFDEWFLTKNSKF